MTAGLTVAAAGFTLAATVAGLPGLLPAAVLIGIGAGLVTPLAFAALAASTAPERLGQTVGAPKSAVNSATPAARCSSAPSPPPPL